MQPPNAISLQPKNRIASIAARHWPLLVPGVLLLAAHLLPIPQNGALGALPTICPFKTLSGCPCPGCGLTRAVVLCAHGDWTGAFIFHPLGALFYLGMWLALALGVLPALIPAIRKKFAISQRALMLGSSAFAATMVIVWLIRLTGVFPYPTHF